MAVLAIFDAPAVDLHRVPGGFPEVPARVQEVRRRLASSYRDALRCGERVLAVSEAELRRAIERVHPAPYAERLQRAVERGDGLFDTADNPLSPGTFHAALAAAELAVRAARWSVGVEDPGTRGVIGSRRAFCLTRPPGHHAERSAAMGFCYFNNVAVAAEEFLAAGLERVAIVDFDVHHGNGTQHQFEERPDVFFASLHQYPFYPGTGSRDEDGLGEGVGSTLNLPLPAGTSGPVFLDALRTAVIPALRAFAPAAILVSAGFDAWRGDPLGGLRLEVDDYRRIGETLAAVAEELSGGRGLAVLEGGYDLAALPDLVEAFLDGWRGA